MPRNEVKAALKSSQVQLGMNFGQLRSAEIPRLMAAAGFHWAFIDAEHGNFGIETVGDLCRVANLAGVSPIVRVADVQYSLVARALDCGAQGIIFPRMEDPKLLETAIAWTLFPPDGVRGYGLQASQTGYAGRSIAENVNDLNLNTLRIVQIESVRSVEASADLISVPGVDAVLIGPADLSISMRIPGEFQNPALIAAAERVRDVCLGRGVAPGIHTRSAPLARFWKERGMLLLGCGSDIGFLWEKASETAREVLR